MALLVGAAPVVLAPVAPALLDETPAEDIEAALLVAAAADELAEETTEDAAEDADEADDDATEEAEDEAAGEAELVAAEPPELEGEAAAAASQILFVIPKTPNNLIRETFEGDYREGVLRVSLLEQAEAIQGVALLVIAFF